MQLLSGRLVLGTLLALFSWSSAYGDATPPPAGQEKPQPAGQEKPQPVEQEKPQPPSQTAKPPSQGTSKPAAAATKPRPASAPLTLTVEVTDRSGNTLSDVSVQLAGALERSGATGEDGSVVFRTMRAGTYRLRFEHDEFTTLEREVVIRAGQPASVTVALTPAPVAAPPPAPDPPKPPEAPERPARQVDPRSLSIPDFLDKNLIGNEPQRTTLLACAEGGTGRLLQIREPLTNQEHADVDEVLYIVAGAGVVRMRNQDSKVGPGVVVLVPRGEAHSIRREGRNPLIALSVLAGEPCVEGAVPSR